jgi:hypothetical protein
MPCRLYQPTMTSIKQLHVPLIRPVTGLLWEKAEVHYSRRVRARSCARSHVIYAELVGTGMTADAYHLTAPHPDGREPLG